VWEVLRDAERWPEWWRGVVRVTELAPEERYLIAWRSRIPYELQFEFAVRNIDPPCCMAGDAIGELHGSGRWRLFEDAGITAVTYEWNVETTKPWMNLVAPIARRIFEYNHNVVMRWGGEGLAKRLDCKLLAAG
jgi:hypothetical protein